MMLGKHPLSISLSNNFARKSNSLIGLNEEGKSKSLSGIEIKISIEVERLR